MFSQSSYFKPFASGGDEREAEETGGIWVFREAFIYFFPLVFLSTSSANACLLSPFAQTASFFRQGNPRILTLVHGPRAEAFAFMPPIKAVVSSHDGLGSTCPRFCQRHI